METIWNIQEDVENKKYGANLAEKIKLLLREYLVMVNQLDSEFRNGELNL